MIQRILFILAFCILIAQLWGAYRINATMRSHHPKIELVDLARD